MKEDTTQIDPTWMEKTGGYAKDMTLRDYLAAQAMQGLIADGVVPELSAEVIAEMSFAMANAMLVERNL